MLSCWTWCRLALSALVTSASLGALVASPSLATLVASPSLATLVAGPSLAALISGPTPISIMAPISVLGRRARLSLRSGWSWRCWARVAPGNK
jgi:hypothetical protein